MPKAIWNDVVVAEANESEIELVEGNTYFPKDSIKQEYFKKSDTTSKCPWKGKANYFTLEVMGQTNEDAAWTYLKPLSAAESIKDFVAFWKGVKIEK